MNAPRAVVLVTEGVSLDLLDRWGPDVLPAFHRARAQEVGGTMLAEHVPYEPSGLYTAFTGFPPADHGCFSYWAVHTPDYRPATIEGPPSLPFVWQRPELADRVTAVVNVFGTHPVRPSNGYCISYPMRSTMHACHPRDLPVRLAREGVQVVHDVTVWFTGGERETFVEQVLDADRRRAAAVEHLLDGRLGDPPDLTVLNLTAIDRLSHVYWQELEAGSPVPEAEQAVRRAYVLADEVLGRLLRRVDERTSLLAFSEIGFGPLRAYCPVNDALAEAGLLALDTEGDIDRAASVAFESVQGSQGVNLNLTGRYRAGRVSPQDRRAVLADVRSALLGYVNPRTGTPLLADAVPREELHEGDAVGEAPDLVLEPYDWRYLPLGDPYWAGRTNRVLQSGWHRRDSYWAGVGPAFSGAPGGIARTLDVAPTLVAMLGRQVPHHPSGRSLAVAP